MDFFSAMEVSASGLTAERTRLNVAASNLANASTTRTDAGGPYKRRDVVLSASAAPSEVSGGTAGGFEQAVRGVEVKGIQDDAGAPRMEYDPGHPDADANGYVAYPNVNVVEEMVDMITASRAYQAGMTALDGAVNLAERALTIGRSG